MENLYENKNSRPILVQNSENYYVKGILDNSFDENSFSYYQNLFFNEHYNFQPEFINNFEEENKNNLYYFNNAHDEEDEKAPNLDNMPIYNIITNINNDQNDLNVGNNILLGRKTKKWFDWSSWQIC